MNDWLPRVADLVDSMIVYWKKLVPMKSKDGGRAAILFRCIHSLMSRQVQGLIRRSVDHLYNVLAVYKVEQKILRQILLCFFNVFFYFFVSVAFFYKSVELALENRELSLVFS